MTDYTEKKAGTEKTKDFDFDYWCRLAKENPDVFETTRKQELDKYISKLGDTSTQERMKKLQWRIEMERQRSKNPMDSAIRIYDMMWETVGKNFELIQELADEFRPQGETAKTKTAERSQAKVLPFNRETHTGTVG